MPIRAEVDASALVISVMSRMLKSSGWPAGMRCRSWSKLRDLLDRGRDRGLGCGLHHDLVDVREAHRLRRVLAAALAEGWMYVRASGSATG